MGFLLHPGASVQVNRPQGSVRGHRQSFMPCFPPKSGFWGILPGLRVPRPLLARQQRPARIHRVHVLRVKHTAAAIERGQIGVARLAQVFKRRRGREMKRLPKRRQSPRVHLAAGRCCPLHSPCTTCQSPQRRTTLSMSAANRGRGLACCPTPRSRFCRRPIFMLPTKCSMPDPL